MSGAQLLTALLAFVTTPVDSTRTPVELAGSVEAASARRGREVEPVARSLPRSAIVQAVGPEVRTDAVDPTNPSDDDDWSAFDAVIESEPEPEPESSESEDDRDDRSGRSLLALSCAHDDALAPALRRFSRDLAREAPRPNVPLLGCASARGPPPRA